MSCLIATTFLCIVLAARLAKDTAIKPLNKQIHVTMVVMVIK
jgi:hypothetical protein